MKKEITYRPSYGLNKHYESSGIIHKETNYDVGTIDKIETSPLEKIENNLTYLKGVMDYIPNRYTDIVTTLINTLEFLFIQIDEDKIQNHGKQDKPKDADIIVKPPEDDGTNKSNNGSLIFNEDLPFKEIKTNPKNKTLVTNIRYTNIILDIVTDNSNVLVDILNEYVTKLLKLLHENPNQTIQLFEKRYTYSTKECKDSNNKHVSDYIVKSQIIRDQKTRLMDKLINTSESLVRIKNCELARELLTRYYNEKLGDVTKQQELDMNLDLIQGQEQYRHKMKWSLYDLYKYLNSSAEMLKDCLELYLKEGEGKLLLAEKEKFAF